MLARIIFAPKAMVFNEEKKWDWGWGDLFLFFFWGDVDNDHW